MHPRSASDEESDNDLRAAPPNKSASSSWWARRVAVARTIKKDREQRVLHLHHTKSRHIVDHAFSFVMGNLAIVCWVLGGMYGGRACEKPLSAFLVILGCLAPFAMCTPVLVRQWFYLHLRLNVVTCSILFMTLLFGVWLFVGQRWAFESSPRNCDDELSTVTNAVVFIAYAATLLYMAKLVWYVLLRVRYKYSALCVSCWTDPYPNALRVSDDDFIHLEAIVVATAAPTGPSAPSGKCKHYSP
jgi:hypothetical protein